MRGRLYIPSWGYTTEPQKDRVRFCHTNEGYHLPKVVGGTAQSSHKREWVDFPRLLDLGCAGKDDIPGGLRIVRVFTD